MPASGKAAWSHLDLPLVAAERAAGRAASQATARSVGYAVRGLPLPEIHPFAGWLRAAPGRWPGPLRALAAAARAPAQALPAVQTLQPMSVPLVYKYAPHSRNPGTTLPPVARAGAWAPSGRHSTQEERIAHQWVAESHPRPTAGLLAERRRILDSERPPRTARAALLVRGPPLPLEAVRLLRGRT